MNRQSVLKNQKGQMALFLVLIFQILFVFFAMSINVGLVVYDKINLQNSTDIAAYYAAQKQSEMLNQIAHINYQIRQAYKLLSFRIRVLGSLSIGMGSNTGGIPRHPAFSNPQVSDEAVPHFPRLGTSRHAPGVCVGSTLWYEYGITEGNASSSLCQRLDAITAVPALGGGADPLGLIGGLNDFLTAVKSELRERCMTVNVLNWQVAASFLTAYILEADRRMKMIRALSTKLSTPGTEMQDHLGGSVFNGALNTLKKNLTAPQRETVQMKLLNSLSSDIEGPCGDANFWLPDIELYPIVSYVQMLFDDGPRGACDTKVVSSRDSATIPPPNYLSMVGGRNNALLSTVWSNDAPIKSGVEKNPWCMPFIKLSAQTQPRKIFAPFGGVTTLKAESFAKPFGGRIGPWYSKQWPSGSPTSQGLDRVDPLLPARSISGQRLGAAPEDDLVNYSKYPGDQHGLNSKYALGVMYNYVYNTLVRQAPLDRMPPVLALAHFNHIGDPDEFDNQPDSLARTNNGGVTGDPIRYMELAAIAPDLFDITYYSIEGQYTANYFNTDDVHFTTKDQFENYFIDLGSQNRQPYSVVDQITSSREVYAAQYPFYQVESPNQLLTGWTQNGAVDYSFPEDFGQCLLRNDGDVMARPSPSGCPQGGRSGYSVKIVSKNYLISVEAELGGPGLSGPILNPPPAD